ncbi:CBO0543 family protein [Paenibacillus sepulcri]|uniref:Transmembrane protein n=1 Tax=Paenibacillus sepulcri TaxID=359917 RepID=A0ABS7C8Y9_9BACL|nr:hypothetical protein [Paenibacillus sepulcri]
MAVKESPTFEEIKEISEEWKELRNEYWLHHDLFTPQWWFLLAALIIPWVIWWKLVDRSRLTQIVILGLITIIVVDCLDDIGSMNMYWSYPYQLLRISPRLISVDYSMLPVIHMLTYQYFRSWKPFMIVHLILSAVFAFAFEPIMEGLGIYEPHHWKHIYSFPIYLALAIAVRWVTERVMYSSAARRRQLP